MYLVVRYLHVPQRCSKCQEYGHCEGEGKECKVVQIATGKELVLAEKMTATVAWVPKQGVTGLHPTDGASSSSTAAVTDSGGDKAISGAATVSATGY
ncbi:unnamed protein product [Linum trigynum]|uniref:Uncharacterized protein n=1 Tax=Linum trigynum TaxID=586398 RepID=A0AAV2FNU1_9ROSI